MLLRSPPDSRPLLMALALSLLGAFGCDSTDVGRPAEPKGPPTLRRIIFLDAANSAVTDLLDRTPARACSAFDPCPADPTIACVIPDGAEEGQCSRPLVETPISVGEADAPVRIRVVTDQLLDPAINARLEADVVTSTRAPSGMVALVGPDGLEVPSRKYYDPTGSPDQTSDLVSAPFGPAVVIVPAAPLEASATYVLLLEPSSWVNRRGEALAMDVDGPVRTRYEAKTEGLYTKHGVSPDFVTPPMGEGATEVAADDYFQLSANDALDVRTSSVVVERVGGGRVTVAAFTDCDKGARVLDLVPTSSSGAPSPWAPGEYTISVTGVRSASGRGELAYDAKATPLEGRFVVAPDADPTNPVASLVLPPCPAKED